MAPCACSSSCSRWGCSPGARRPPSPGSPGNPVPGGPTRGAPTCGSRWTTRAPTARRPRGVGESSPISCGLTPEEVGRAGVDDAAGPDAESLAASTARACTANAPDLVHTTTPNLARDMDRLREALGVERISYYGTSGGTTLGTTYASLFPDRVDRMVLDSVDDDTVGRQAAFRAADRAIDARFAQLPLPGPDPRARYLALLARLDREVVLFDGVRATSDALRSLLAAALRSDAAVPLLVDAVRHLDGLPGAPTEAEPAQRLGPEPAPDPGAERVASAFLGITCADPDWSHDPADYRAAVAADAAAYPVSGGARAVITACAYWTGPPTPRVPLTDSGPRNILILQNEVDPATPLDGARATRAALGDRPAMITTGVGGHGVLGRSPCATDAAVAWLVGGELPPGDRRC
ncbi:alpha/beta fold hydrolase [Pseudonocardia oroxyli]|uniref:alpha/beta fold hydrolase n=1 Tax=Pseudonocardia oroxyli TaxID=366584 RepID=UPI003183BD75